MKRLKEYLKKQLYDPFFWMIIGIFVGIGTFILIAMLWYSATY